MHLYYLDQKEREGRKLIGSIDATKGEREKWSNKLSCVFIVIDDDVDVDYGSITLIKNVY